ncbi:ABC transporter permease [Arabiibacter massiliensis]|uniref:ABC transporter permease n=1 Tax=Arabiibacter massiliensis TaxID=1870985 RepID=UPI0009BA45CA|nr:ABC transporter permease [Arabiibacter massiliensis]
MEFLQDVAALFTDRWAWFAELLGAHIALSAVAIAVAGVAGLALGILISEHRRFAAPVIGVCNVLYTIPSISLLGLLLPFLGIGNPTAVAALIIYALMPMVRNTYVGLTEIDPDVIEAARGMGSTRTQTLVHVRLPMATSVILAGLRSMVVMTISVAAIASFIGAGGLGVAIYRGITLSNSEMVFAGSLLVALLAFAADLLLGAIEKRYKRKRRLTTHEKR